jgi:hypothetical protein
MDTKELGDELGSVFTLLDTWATGHKDLTLIYGSGNCRIEQNGSLGKVSKDTYWFTNQFGLRVVLHPDQWKSLERRENCGVVLFIDGGASDSGLVLRENTEKGPEPIEISKEVSDQLERWAEQGKVVHVLYHRGFVTTVGTVRVHIASKGDFILIDEKTQEVHVIAPERSSGIELLEKEDGCEITLWDPHQTLVVGEIYRTAEDAMQRFTSNLIH